MFGVEDDAFQFDTPCHLVMALAIFDLMSAIHLVVISGKEESEVLKTIEHVLKF